MRDLTNQTAWSRALARVTAPVPQGATTLSPGALAQPKQKPGTDMPAHHQHHHGKPLDDLDATPDGATISVTPSLQQPGPIQDSLPEAAMTAPGAPPGDASPAPGQDADIHKGDPAYPWEFPGIPKAAPGFTPTAWTGAGGDQDGAHFGRVRPPRRAK
jgi:hypothetical protein